MTEEKLQELIDSIQIGSQWIHSNGNIYVVMYIANNLIPRKKKYPVTVVYENYVTGDIFTGVITDWYRRMKRFFPTRATL